MNELTVQYKPVDKLIPYARNPRIHSDEQVAQVAASIREFGFTNPVLLDGENGVIAGHGRLLAARKLEMDSIPCIDLVGLSEAQKRAYIIADNKLALNAGWDDEMLGNEFLGLEEFDFDLSLTGFDADELDGLLADDLGDSDVSGSELLNGTLADRFLAPPFSVLDARQGWWQDRKRAWLALGIKSEIGRRANALDMSATMVGIKSPELRELWNTERRSSPRHSNG